MTLQWTWLNPLFYVLVTGMGVIGWNYQLPLTTFLIGVPIAAGIGYLIDRLDAAR